MKLMLKILATMLLIMTLILIAGGGVTGWQNDPIGARLPETIWSMMKGVLQAGFQSLYSFALIGFTVFLIPRVRRTDASPSTLTLISGIVMILAGIVTAGTGVYQVFGSNGFFNITESFWPSISWFWTMASYAISNILLGVIILAAPSFVRETS